MAKPVIGILALQGAFREHGQMLSRLGCQTREIRQARDLTGVDGFIIPGGESTTIGKLLVELEIMEPLRHLLLQGKPVFGTCAGLILLSARIENADQPRLGLLAATIERNAFGRQIDSFETDLVIPTLGAQTFPAIFIRAPLLQAVGPNVQVLASISQKNQARPVAVRQNNILGASFHPELTGDTRFHEYFLKMF